MNWTSRHNRLRFIGLRLLAALLIAAAVAFVLMRGRIGGPHVSLDPFIKVVRIPLGPGMEIRPALAEGDLPRSEAFGEMIERLRPYAAINGTFYNEQMRPLGDVLIHGKLANRGAYRHAIAISNSGEVRFIERRRGGFRWSGYKAGLAAGPRLVHRGKIALDPVRDGFTRHGIVVKAWRSGVGITKNNELLLVMAMRSMTFAQFANTMLDLGAVEAMNLDGGGACGLYCQGRTLASPTLRMTNILVVYKNPVHK